MAFRNDLEALSQRAEALRTELDDAHEQLATAQEVLLREAKKDEEQVARMAELEQQVNDLREQMGLQPLPLSREKKEISTIALLLMIGVPVLAAIGVALIGLMTPVGEEPPRIFPLLAGGAFALGGLPMIGLALGTFGKDRDIAGWPKAKGRIDASGLESYTGTEKDQYGYYRSYELFSPTVTYTYVVDGNELMGSGIARVVDMTGRASAEACVERYPAGKEVEVFYDPEDPATSYLEVRRSTGAIILLLFGLLLTGIGVAVGSVFFA